MEYAVLHVLYGVLNTNPSLFQNAMQARGSPMARPHTPMSPIHLHADAFSHSACMPRPQIHTSSIGLGSVSSAKAPQPSTCTHRASSAMASVASGISGSADNATDKEVYPGVFEGFWTWRGHRIRYQRSGTEGEPIVLVHGFGGNADHWRKVSLL